MLTWADDLRQTIRHYYDRKIIPIPQEVQDSLKKMLGDLLCGQAFASSAPVKLHCVIFAEYCAAKDFPTWSEHAWFKTEQHIRELSLLAFLKEQGFQATLLTEPSRILVEVAV